METTQPHEAAPGKNASASFIILNIPKLEPGASGRSRPAYGLQDDASWPDRTRGGFKAQWALIIVIVGFIAGWLAANLLPG